MLTFRRLSFIAALVVSACAPALAQTQMQVVSGEGCGCCGEWVKHLLSSGYTAKVTIVPQDKLMTYKDEHGLKPAQTSCHTGTIGGYVIEGHVPQKGDIPETDIERAPTLAAAFAPCCWLLHAYYRR